MLSSRTRLWALATAALCVLLLIGAYFLLISPKQAQAAALGEEREQVVQNNSTLEARIAQLKAEAVKQPQREAELAMIERQMTPLADTANLVRELDALADQSGVDLVTVTPAGAVALNEAGQAAATGTATTGTATTGSGNSASGNTGSGNTASGSTATSGTAAGGTGATQSASGSTLVALPMTIVVRGDYFETALFLKKVQTQLVRLMLVGNVTVATSDPQAEVGGATNGIVDMTLAAQAYVYWPDAAAAAKAVGDVLSGTDAAGTPGASSTTTSPSTSPTAGATPTPSATSTGTPGENQ